MKESGYTIKDLITSDKEMQQDVMNAQEVKKDTTRILPDTSRVTEQMGVWIEPYHSVQPESLGEIGWAFLFASALVALIHWYIHNLL